MFRVLRAPDKTSSLEPARKLMHRLRRDKTAPRQLSVRQTCLAAQRAQRGVLRRGQRDACKRFIHCVTNGLLGSFDYITKGLFMIGHLPIMYQDTDAIRNGLYHS